VGENGNIDARTRSNGSGDCRELHKYYKTMYLGLRDNADPDASYMITVQCVESWVWNHCDMPPEKTIYGVVLEVGKRDTRSMSMDAAGRKHSPDSSDRDKPEPACDYLDTAGCRNLSGSEFHGGYAVYSECTPWQTHGDDSSRRHHPATERNSPQISGL
jgi:hypothetical protein